MLEVRLILCHFINDSVDQQYLLYPLFRYEGCGPDQCSNRVLFPAEMCFVPHGRGLLRSICSGDAYSRHSWFLDFDLLRSSKFTAYPPGDYLSSSLLPHQLLGDHVRNIVFSCSEYEARNYGISIDLLCSFFPLIVTLGRFLLGLLMDLLKWHQDEQQYLQDNRVKGAGKAAYLPGLQLRWTNKPTVAVSDLAKWSEVQQFNRKCHRKLAKVGIRCCYAPLVGF